MGMGKKLLVDPDISRWHFNPGESAAQGCASRPWLAARAVNGSRAVIQRPTKAT